MAGSGVAVDSDVQTTFSEINKQHKYRYVLFKLNDNLSEIVVDKKAPKDASYQTFMADMKDAEGKGECRWAVYDFPFSTNSGAQKDKLVFISWSPEDARIKQKMVYASSKEILKKALGSCPGITVQTTDEEELSEENILSTIKSFDKA